MTCSFCRARNFLTECPEQCITRLFEKICQDWIRYSLIEFQEHLCINYNILELKAICVKYLQHTLPFYNKNDYIDLISDYIMPNVPSESLITKVKIITHIHDETTSQENVDCTICFENVSSKSIVKLGCKHLFCAQCITSILKLTREKRCCPLCRVSIQKIEIQSNNL